MDERDLPPLAPPGASDEERGRAVEARMAARSGAPTVEEFRRTYRSFGAEWPGDEEIRRRHVVADEQIDRTPRAEGGAAPHSAA